MERVCEEITKGCESMQRVTWSIFTALVFCFLPAGWCLAADYDIYIKNHQYTGKVIRQNKEIFIELESLAKFAALTLEQKGKAWQLSVSSPGAPKEALPEASEGFWINGAKSDITVISDSGKPYVPLKRTADALGALYSENSQTGIIDVTFPKKGMTAKDYQKASEKKPFSFVFFYMGSNENPTMKSSLAAVQHLQAKFSDQFTFNLVNMEDRDKPEYSHFFKSGPLGIPPLIRIYDKNNKVVYTKNGAFTADEIGRILTSFTTLEKPKEKER
ncbi:MAG: hypothetical protein RDV48_21530 [Candidatus Eremiobacteraeota bacterium]|nr:hypothetical protein [Candidatus Eremiobacteraeota bacterium]